MTSQDPTPLNSYSFLLFAEKGHQHKNFLSIMRAAGVQSIPVISSLNEAIQRIIAQKFDLIFVTHYGRAAEATRLLEELRSHDATSRLTIAAITRGGNVKDMLRIMAKGAVEVLVEPFSQDEVENLIHRVLKAKSQPTRESEGLKSAEKLIALGQYRQAEPILEVIMDDPEVGLSAHMAMLKIAIFKDDKPKAESLLRKSLEMAKAAEDKTDKARMLCQVFHGYGRYYQHKKSLAKAIKSYRTAFGLNPFHLDNFIALLSLLQKEDDLDEIVKVATEAGENYMPYSEPMEVIAETLADIAEKYADLGMGEHASRLYEILLELKHEEADVHLTACRFFLDQGDTARVVANLIGTSQRIKDPDLLYLLGNVLLEGDFDPDGESPHGLLANLDHDKAMVIARQAFHQAMLLDPTDIRFRLGLAGCELALNNVDGAINVLDKLKEGDFRTREVFRQVIEKLLDENALELVDGWLAEAEQDFPGDRDITKLKARYLRIRGETFEAVGCLKRALSKDPEDVELLVDLAGLYHDMDQPSDAMIYYEKALKLAPKDDAIKQAMQKAMAEA